jgi:hypothetical protein
MATYQYAINPLLFDRTSQQKYAFSQMQPSRSEMVRAAASFYPEIKANIYNQQQAEEAMALERRLARQQARQSNIATGIQAAKVGLVDTGAYKPIYEHGIKPLYQGMTGLTSVPNTTQSSIPTIPSRFNDVMLNTGAPPVQSSSLPIGSELGTGVTNATVPATQTGTGVFGTGLTPLGVGSAAFSGYGMGQMAQNYNWGNKLFGDIAGKRERNMATGALSGFLTGFVGTGFNPIGGAIGAAGGAAGACIIVTVCTSPDSYEVNVTREYRKRFMDAESIRGYYMLADQLVPLLKKHTNLRELFKIHLVDRLVDYGEFKLGNKTEMIYSESRDVAKSFLRLCKQIGATIPRYIRSNGEVV